MRIAVVGSRNFSDYKFFREKLEYLIQNLDKNDIEWVSGGAIGTDSLCRRYAEENNYKITEYLPDYINYSGKIAPLKRNHEIVDNCDMLIAFTTGSNGTAYTIKLAEKQNKPIRIVKV